MTRMTGGPTGIQVAAVAARGPENYHTEPIELSLVTWGNCVRRGSCCVRMSDYTVWLPVESLGKLFVFISEAEHLKCFNDLFIPYLIL
jgi:hypothetical protein